MLPTELNIDKRFFPNSLCMIVCFIRFSNSVTIKRDASFFRCKKFSSFVKLFSVIWFYLIEKILICLQSVVWIPQIYQGIKNIFEILVHEDNLLLGLAACGKSRSMFWHISRSLQKKSANLSYCLVDASLFSQIVFPDLQWCSMPYNSFFVYFLLFPLVLR